MVCCSAGPDLPLLCVCVCMEAMLGIRPFMFAHAFELANGRHSLFV